MYHVFLQAAPAGLPDAQFETRDEVAVFVEEWCACERESLTGLCPCVTWHENGTEAIPSGTV